MLHLYNQYHSSSSLLNDVHDQDDRKSNRSNYQLFRYNHEPIISNSLRRDVPPILILLFFLFLIVITLSQILVVHSSRYGANFSTMQQIQEELKQMDESMEAILRDNVLPIDKWRLLFQIQTYLYRFENLFQTFDNLTESINNGNQNESLSNVHLQQLLKPLLNKSHELLNKKNQSIHLKENIQRVHSHLVSIIDNHPADQQYHHHYHHRQIIDHDLMNNSKKMNDLCDEQPKHLRTFI